jgi:phospholipase/carboxylesterase
MSVDRTPPALGWHHVFVPPYAQPDDQAAPVTLLLLHGTGGDEEPLLGLGRQVAPAANLLSVRGRSLDEGFPRFFRRFEAVRYDQENIRSEALALGRFVRDAAARYGFDPAGLVALGYSNGANIALAMLAYDPEALAAAVLLRSVMPLDDPPATELAGVPVLVLAGQRDPYQAHARTVAPYLRAAGADVQEMLLSAGHDLTRDDLLLAKDFVDAFASGLRGEAEG